MRATAPAHSKSIGEGADFFVLGLGQFRFGSSLNPDQPPGGGIAVAGPYVYVADSGNNRIERFNLSGGEAMQWGGAGSGAVAG